MVSSRTSEACPVNTLVVTATAGGALLYMGFPTGRNGFGIVALAWDTMVPYKIPAKTVWSPATDVPKKERHPEI